MIDHWSTATPAGPLTVAVDSDGVVRAAGFTAAEPLLDRLGHPESRAVADLGGVSEAVRAWLAGDLDALSQVPCRQDGTSFQQAVWQALRSIPAGQTASYGEVAATIGRPRATRAVGAACGRNLLAPFVPCHRAVRSNGGHGGYAYGLAAKAWLLDHEVRSRH